MIRGLITAVRTLTAIPVPGRDAPRLSSALIWFPAVGVLLGLVICGIIRLHWLVTGTTWPEGAAVLAIIAGVVLTRGIHLDGLADWADGFWGSTDREKILEIMKDPRIGSFGAIALVCAVLAKWVCLVRLIGVGALEWIIAAYAVSRAMPVVLLVAQPYARSGGGTAAPFAHGAGQKHLAVAMIQAIMLVLLICGFRWVWPVTILVACGFAWLFGLWCRSRVGGITGDLLGACSEIVETGILAAGAYLVFINCGKTLTGV